MRKLWKEVARKAWVSLAQALLGLCLREMGMSLAKGSQAIPGSGRSGMARSAWCGKKSILNTVAGLPTENTVTANGVTIYYEESGQGDPLILLHGSSSANWRAFVPQFARHKRVIVPDARNHGRTTFATTATRPAHPDPVVGDVVALMDALGLNRASLCGWSGGGDTALHVAHHYPERVAALIVGGATMQVTEAMRNTLKVMGLDGPGKVNLERARQTIPEMLAEWQQKHAQFPDHWLRLLERQSHMMLNPPLLTKGNLSAIDVPTLVIWGDRDQFLPVEQAVEVYRALPDARLAIIPNADHFVTRTHPAQFGQHVTDFLAALPLG